VRKRERPKAALVDQLSWQGGAARPPMGYAQLSGDFPRYTRNRNRRPSDKGERHRSPETL